MLVQVVFTVLLAISKATQPTPCPDSCLCDVMREGGITVECASYSELPADLPTGVAKLVLEGNNLTSLSHDKVSRAALTNLQALYLEGNKINYIPENAIRDFPSMKVLDLTNNGLLKLHQNSFTFSTNLTTLLIAQNKNLTLPKEDVFLFSSSITRVDLSDNNIETLNVKIFRGLTNLTYINIARNPQINCTHIRNELQDSFRQIRKVSCDETETVDFQYMDRVTKKDIESRRLIKEKRMEAFLQDTVDSVLRILTLGSIYTCSIVMLVLICYLQILRMKRNSSVPYMSLYN